MILAALGWVLFFVMLAMYLTAAAENDTIEAERRHQWYRRIWVVAQRNAHTYELRLKISAMGDTIRSLMRERDSLKKPLTAVERDAIQGELMKLWEARTMGRATVEIVRLTDTLWNALPAASEIQGEVLQFRVEMIVSYVGPANLLAKAYIAVDERTDQIVTGWSDDLALNDALRREIDGFQVWSDWVRQIPLSLQRIPI